MMRARRVAWYFVRLGIELGIDLLPQAPACKKTFACAGAAGIESVGGQLP